MHSLILCLRYILSRRFKDLFADLLATGPKQLLVLVTGLGAAIRPHLIAHRVVCLNHSSALLKSTSSTNAHAL